MVAGNSQVLIASHQYPLPSCTFAVLATSDVSAGIVNIITGIKTDLIPSISQHMDVDLLLGMSHWILISGICVNLKVHQT